MIVSNTIWIITLGILAAAFILDFVVVDARPHVFGPKQAARWVVAYIIAALLFAVFVWNYFGPEYGQQFLAGWITEYSLSVDNLFVFILVFNFFKVPEESHHKVLFWGIIGALFMRALFIFSGVGLINYTYLPAINLFNKEVSINLVLSGFGLFLIYAGIKSWFADEDDEEQDFSKSRGSQHLCRSSTFINSRYLAY